MGGKWSIVLTDIIRDEETGRGVERRDWGWEEMINLC